MTHPFYRSIQGAWQFAAASTIVAAAIVPAAHAQVLTPNNVVISRSVIYSKPNTVTVGQILPPDCSMTTGGCAGLGGAVNNGVYPFIFNNDTYDSSFGVTTGIYLDEFTRAGRPLAVVIVPSSSTATGQLVTSFPSKSELALNLSTGGNYITFMGYVTGLNKLDVSNSDTPLVIDPTDPVGEKPVYRAVARMDANANFTFTETNAYSGNNGRAAIYNDAAQLFYTAGNAGNGSNPQPNGIILGAGAQLIPVVNTPEAVQSPGTPTPVASFNITTLGNKADKIGKDDNFRGMTIFNNVLYFTKGSGGNGVNTVYFVDTTGTACPHGVGLPVPGAQLPIAPLTYNPNNLQSTGLPTNMCILAGFPTALAKTAKPLAAPFGLWFANSTTLYVADEGDGYTGGADLYTHAAAQTRAGLQKWVFNSTTKQWSLAYVLTNGLNIGTPYTVAGYPTGINSATGLPWAPATDGLRNITGNLGPNGTAIIWVVTSTVSGNGDVGADPNKVLNIVDNLANTGAAGAASETFRNFDNAKFGEVLRGIAYTPGTDFSGAQNLQ